MALTSDHRTQGNDDVSHSGFDLPFDPMQIVSRALDHSDDIVAILRAAGSRDLRIHWANGAFGRACGRSPGSLVGQSFSLIVESGTDPDVVAFGDAVAARTALRTALPCIQPGGRRFWLGLHLMPLADDGPAGPLFVLLGRDITEQHRARQERDATNYLLAKVFAVIDAAVAITAPSGEFLMTNPAFDRLHGAPVGSLAGRDGRTLIPPGETERVAAARRRQESDGRDFKLRTRRLRLDGASFEAEIASTMLERPRSCRILTVRELGAAEPAAATRAPASDDAGAPRFKVAGRIQLIGLEAVREAVGDRWSTVAARALQTAEHIIERNLAPGDSFSRSGETGFMLCFGDASEEEAAFRAAAIGREIRHRLIGESDVPEAAQVSSIAAKVALPAGMSPDMPAEALASLLDEQFAARRQELEARAQRMLEQGIREAACSLSPIEAREGQKSAIYIAALAQRTERLLQAALSALPPEQTKEFDLDIMTLRLAEDRVMSDTVNGTAGLYFVNVGFDTFQNRARLDRYLAACRELREAFRSRLCLLITLYPRGVIASRILDCAHKLRPFCRSVGFEFEGGELPAADLAAAGGPVIALSAECLPAPDGSPASRLGQLLTAMQARRSKLMVRRVDTLQAARQLRAAGVALIAMTATEDAGDRAAA